MLPLQTVEDGFIIPKTTGTTELTVSSPGKKDKSEYPLKVEVQTKRLDMLLKKGHNDFWK